MEKYVRARHATDRVMWCRKDGFGMLDNLGKSTDVHSEYVILFACPWHQWLNARTSVLYYTYIVCLVSIQAGLILHQGYVPEKHSAYQTHKYRLKQCIS